MTGAYVLKEELMKAGGDVPGALARYEQKFRPLIKRKQRTGRNLARWFLPDSILRLKVRDLLLQASTWSAVAGIIRYGID
jgi:2-polyprenyl-6-methoxyphenol hydroxylase-like FAD-dependent oxidoreductase